MKKLNLAIAVAILSITVFGQSKPATKPATLETPTVSETTKKANALILVSQIETFRIQQAMCGYKPEDEKCIGLNDKLVAAYEEAISNPYAVNFLIGNAIAGFEKTRTQARGAGQVSQLADEQNAVLMRLIVLQNQKIIELLEQLNKKK